MDTHVCYVIFELRYFVIIISFYIRPRAPSGHSRLNQNKPYAFCLSFLGPLSRDVVCQQDYKILYNSKCNMVISSFSYMLHRKKTCCIKFYSTFLLKKKRFQKHILLFHIVFCQKSLFCTGPIILHN